MAAGLCDVLCYKCQEENQSCETMYVIISSGSAILCWVIFKADLMHIYCILCTSAGLYWHLI